MTIRGDVIRALQDLGEHPHAVAVELKLAGCEGIREALTSCPVANYVSNITGQICEVGIAGSIYFGDTFIQAPIPIPLFVGLFDNGEFPNLVAEEIWIEG